MAFKYVSIDIETTGVDEANCQILEIGAVYENVGPKLPYEKIPKWKGIIYHKNLTGTAFAFNMNKRIIDILAEYESFSHEQEEQKNAFVRKHNICQSVDSALRELEHWLEVIYPNYKDGAKINIAGKNFPMFDLLFLKQSSTWERIHHQRRIIDPATLFLDWHNDEVAPNLDTCLKRAGYEKKVTHDAQEDAFDVVCAFRKFY